MDKNSAFLAMLNPLAANNQAAPMLGPMDDEAARLGRLKLEQQEAARKKKLQEQQQQRPVVPDVEALRAQQQAPPMFMPQLDRDYVNQFKQYLESRQTSAEDLENALGEASKADFSGIQNTDWSPLLGFVDAQTGSKFSQGYAKPTAKKDHQAMMMKMAEALQKEKGGISDDQLKYLGMQGSMSNSRAIMEQGRQGRFQDSQAIKREDTIRKEVGKISEAYDKRQEQFDTIRGAIASGDLGMVKQLLSQIARNIGGEKGALSDGDVQRAFPTDAITTIEGFKLWLTGQGSMSRDVEARLTKLLALAEENAATYQREAIERKERAFKGGRYREEMEPGAVGDIIIKDAYDEIPVRFKNAQKAGATIQGNASAGVSNNQDASSRKARLQQLRAKAGR
jgi:hypothetical protein